VRHASHKPLSSRVALTSLVAKQLKKQWVIKQKTKSKWKAQKHREGIVTQRDASSRSGALSDPLKPPQSSVVREERDLRVESDEEQGDEPHNSSGDEPVSIAPVQTKKQTIRHQEEDVARAGPSLRELQRQAYSPASLHHYKSRPLHHSKGGNHGATVPGSSRKKAIGGDTRNRSQRGGQPDMRLRMSAMLEKIKRDYS
jgi:hypothetical protein